VKLADQSQVLAVCPLRDRREVKPQTFSRLGTQVLSPAFHPVKNLQLIVIQKLDLFPAQLFESKAAFLKSRFFSKLEWTTEGNNPHLLFRVSEG